MHTQDARLAPHCALSPGNFNFTAGSKRRDERPGLSDARSSEFSPPSDKVIRTIYLTCALLKSVVLPVVRQAEEAFSAELARINVERIRRSPQPNWAVRRQRNTAIRLTSVLPRRVDCR